MEILRCSVCGVVYDGKEDIEQAKRMKEKWEAACRKDGDEPRGIAPCPNIMCRGELILEGI